jgi:hypothetical protein
MNSFVAYLWFVTSMVFVISAFVAGLFFGSKEWRDRLKNW